MAKSLEPLRPGLLAGAASALLILAFCAGTLAAVFWRSSGGGALGASDWAAIRFTLLQALLSAAISCLLAIPVARALARRRFPGRGAYVALTGAPFILPALAAVMGLLSIFGRSGPLGQALEFLGLPEITIYGLQGVVLAHVFFNLPLAVRLILHGWIAIPAERLRLAAQLGMGRRETFWIIEAPMLRSTLPGIFVTIFLICVSSFAVALALGGGPAATTVELAIYEAFLLDFDLGKASLLAAVQFALCAMVMLLFLRLAKPVDFGAGLDRPVMRWDSSGRACRLADSIALALAAGFLLAPVAAVLWRGAPWLLSLPPDVYASALRSAGVALASAALAVWLALSLASLSVGLRGRFPMGSSLAEAAGYLPIAASPMVAGAGIFIIAYELVNPSDWALAITALVNALMSLPFALRAILPALRDAHASFGRLSQILGLEGMARLRIVTWPRIRRPLLFSAGLAGALSAGDLGVIALFADQDSATLPLMVHRLMGAYRMPEAAGASVLLIALSFSIFALLDRGGRLHARS